MSDLSVFSEDEAALLIRVLYKVGVWVSHADDEEGEEDDVRELKALAACVRAVAQKYDGPGLVDDLARALLNARDRWDIWADEAFNVPAECRQALALMKERGTEQDLKNYKAALVEIGVTVAQAYGEFGQYDDEEEGGVFGALLGRITSGFSSLSATDRDHPMNVSASEESVLSELKALLKEF